MIWLSAFFFFFKFILRVQKIILAIKMQQLILLFIWFPNCKCRKKEKMKEHPIGRFWCNWQNYASLTFQIPCKKVFFSVDQLDLHFYDTSKLPKATLRKIICNFHQPDKMFIANLVQYNIYKARIILRCARCLWYS